MQSDRFGILIIGGALLVIAIILSIIFAFQVDFRTEQIRAQGARLVRTLSGMPWDQLRPTAQRQGALRALLNLGNSREFAYGVLVDPAGHKITEVTSPGVTVPAATFSREPSAWFGEQALVSPSDGKKLQEFYGPALDRGDLKGFIRLGYYSPGYFPSGDQISFLALVALTVFLLAPAFYFMLRRELRPLEHISQHLQRLVADEPGSRLEITPTADLRDFMERLSGFIKRLDERSREIESQGEVMLTANRLLSYKKDKAEAVLQVLPDAVMIMDDAGVITFTSAKIDVLIGVAPEAMVGRTPQQWCQDEGLIGFLMRCQSISAQASRSDGMLYSPAHAPERKIQVTAIPLASHSENTMFSGAVLVFRDVTAETRIKSAGNEFLAYTTHELKTPLNILKLYSELLQGDDGNDKTTRVKAVNAIHDQVERMSSMLNDMKTVALIEMGNLVVDRQRVKLHDLLRDIFEAFIAGGRGAGMDLKLELPTELTPVSLDKGLFAVAVNNLLSNAIKYNRPDGKVRLAATESEQQIVIEVEDTGIGFAAENRERIFDKFFRGEDEATRAREGQGLGLYLTRQIVEMHQGSISARSEPEKGSTFSIVLRKTATLLREKI
ncbi:MAG: HAMP domain-containing histidine kinase [Gammaproteobacteria bacterium]|nr:HAMP domain-containing histidine kinase [Gammaproteobacteria bacterium]MDH3411088.1 HAMP domain-containing histidine kinase [Gammaproteobacteria bacterium]